MEGKRLDLYLVGKYPGVSRSKLQRAIKDGVVRVNSKVVRAGFILSKGDDVFVGDLFLDVVDDIASEKNTMEVIAETSNYIVVNKPPYVVVHPSSTGHYSGTVVNFLISKIDKDDFDVFRPGIVHRLDKDTSGVLLVAKNKKSYLHFASQFKEHSVVKSYIVLVFGKIKNARGIIDAPISRHPVNRKKMSVSSLDSAKSAISKYEVIDVFEFSPNQFVTLLSVEIPTGRTHQIRVHFSSIGYPVVLDKTYGFKDLNAKFFDKFGLNRQFLHAKSLSVVDLDGVRRVFLAKLPEDLQCVIDRL